MSYYTFVRKSDSEQKTHHYLGDLSEKSQQKLLPLPDFLIIEEKSDGIFLNRYTLDGIMAGDTWHPTIEEAKEQATFEYGDSIHEWKEVPSNVEDPISYTLNLLKKN